MEVPIGRRVVGEFFGKKSIETFESSWTPATNQLGIDYNL